MVLREAQGAVGEGGDVGRGELLASVGLQHVAIEAVQKDDDEVLGLRIHRGAPPVASGRTRSAPAHSRGGTGCGAYRYTVAGPVSHPEWRQRAIGWTEPASASCTHADHAQHLLRVDVHPVARLE